MRLPGGTSRTVLAVVLCVGLEAWLGRRFLTARDISPEQLSTIRYEESGGQVVLAVDPWVRLEELPNLDLYDRRREIGVPAGFSLGLPLPDRAGYSVENVSSGNLPRVVVGRVGALSTQRFDGEHVEFPRPHQVLTELLSLAPGEGGAPSVGRWTPGQSWRDDEAPLEALKPCLSAGPPVVTVHREGSRVRFRAGTCEASAEIGGGDLQVGVLAGLDAVGVRRESGEWAIRSSPAVNKWLVGGALILALCLVISYTAGVAFVSLVTLSLLSTWFPFEAGMLGVLLVVLALPVLLIRRFHGLSRLVALALMVLCVGITIQQVRRRFANKHFEVDLAGMTEPPRCIDVGYSTVDGFGLRPGMGGLHDGLMMNCDACRGRTIKVARAGEALDFVRITMCSSLPAGQPDVLFVGGTNDDMWWGLMGGPLVSRLLTGLGVFRFFFDALRVDRTDRFQDPERWKEAGYDQTLRALPDQLREIQGAVGCVRNAGARFFFFHDYLVYDLRDGRAPQRRRLVAERKAETLRAGGTFVDLLDETREVAGPSWFSDPIHLSSVGHRHVAALLCRVKSQAPAH